MHNRVRIIATVGPASWDVDTLKRIIRAGATVLRLNFSHGSLPQHERTIRRIRQAANSVGVQVAVLQDLPGPKIRTGPNKLGQPIQLEDGQRVTITTRRVHTQPGLISTNYPHLPADVKRGDRIVVDDGCIHLRVLSVSGPDVRCEVIFGGCLGEHKGINLPGVDLTARNPTRQDLAFLRFGVQHAVDYIALSFVRNAREVRITAKHLRKLRAQVPLIAKIEKPEALEHLDAILDAADGVMVARGDLAIETSAGDVPIYQKRILALARKKGKLAITATQMLDSMIEAPTPTRAEASDVANAVMRRMALYWGVAPAKIPGCKTVQRLLREGESALLRQRLAKKGDVVVILVGSTLLPGTTNAMNIHLIGSGGI